MFNKSVNKLCNYLLLLDINVNFIVGRKRKRWGQIEKRTGGIYMRFISLCKLIF